MLIVYVLFLNTSPYQDIKSNLISFKVVVLEYSAKGAFNSFSIYSLNSFIIFPIFSPGDSSGTHIIIRLPLNLFLVNFLMVFSLWASKLFIALTKFPFLLKAPSISFIYCKGLSLIVCKVILGLTFKRCGMFLTIIFLIDKIKLGILDAFAPTVNIYFKSEYLQLNINTAKSSKSYLFLSTGKAFLGIPKKCSTSSQS